MPQFGSPASSGPSLQDILAQLGVQGQNLDGSAPDGAIAQLLGGGGQSMPATDPTAGLTAAMADPSGYATAPTQGAPDPSTGLPTPPQFTPMNPVLGVLDQLLLGGAVRGVQTGGFERQKQAYDMQVQRAALMRQLGAIRALPAGRAQADATLNPTDFVKEDAKNFAPVTTPGGDTTAMFGGAGYGGSTLTAPKAIQDPTNGITGWMQPGSAPQLNAYPTIQKKDASQTVSPIAPVILPGVAQPPAARAGAPAANTPPPSPALSAMAPNGKLDPVAFFKTFVLPHEGGLNPSDMNGSPTNFGINQAANPGVDVNKLTPDQAAGIFANKYFANSGAANLPPALAAIHADTAFINPAAAQRFLRRSGGDPADYMARRRSWMAGMVGNNPAAAKYAKAWAQRNADLAQFAGLNGNTPAAPEGAAASDPTTGYPASLTATPIAPPVWNPKTNQFEQTDPTGKVTATGTTSFTPEGLRTSVLGNDDYKSANAALAAYKAMTGNADTMTGPSAYSMLDTFARAINPGAVARPTVIETIEKNLGLPAQVVGTLESKAGQGNLPVQTRQQILDAVYPFLRAHYSQAKALNDQNTAIATRLGMNPQNVTAPLEPLPARLSVGPVPAPQQRTPGTAYSTPKGQLIWTGTGWIKQN